METDGSVNGESSAEPTTRRRRKYSETPPEEPEEKRQKFLERNRQECPNCDPCITLIAFADFALCLSTFHIIAHGIKCHYKFVLKQV